MKRTKEWWQILNEAERCELVALERGANQHYSGSYYPDDCTGCGHCGVPHLGYGLCPLCLNRLIYLIEKADEGIVHEIHP